MSNAQAQESVPWSDDWLSYEDAHYWQRVNRNPPRYAPIAARDSVALRVAPVLALRRQKSLRARLTRLVAVALTYCAIAVVAMFAAWGFVLVMVAGFGG